MLSDKDIRNAEVLGKAMRLGSMFAGSTSEGMAEIDYFPKKKLLKLKLRPDNEALFTEVAEARLNSLATSLDATVDVKTTRAKKG